MLALPLTPTSPQVLLEFDCAPTRATLSSKMVVPSYERPSSPSVFTTTAMAQSRPQAASQKRPKLSLQTSSLPITFGKSSTALAIAASAVPTASPTVVNTFNNAYDMPHRFSPAGASPTGTRSARPTSRLVSPFASSKDDRPYQVSLGLKSILRNSPIPSGLRRSSLCPAGESPRTGRRALFPPEKRVTFRVAVEEEIQTTTYIAKHSDLPSDEEDSDSDERSELSLSSSDESDADETQANTDEQTTQLRKKRKAGSDRQIRAAAIRDCVANVERIQKRLKPTFEMRRKRRRRHWEWTLEPPKETSPQTDTRPQVERSALSPSQIPLPLSGTLDHDEALLSPFKVPMPSSATLPPSEEDKSGCPLPSPSQTPLPSSATLPSPASSPVSRKAREESTKIAAEASRTKR